jgi:5-methylcytosine-specific restriction endonuclease McrA
MESNYLNLSGNQRHARRIKGKGNYLYVRYADDFVVLCNGTKAEAHAMKEELKELLNTMGLTLSEEKTKITHITEGFTFLGYKIIREIGTRGEMVLKVEIPDSAIKRFTDKIRELIAPTSTSDATRAKVIALNSLTRGWCQYYCCTSNISGTFNKLVPELYWGMAHWLGRKYKAKMPVIMQRFKGGHTLKTKTWKLAMPSDIKARKRLVKTWHNPYTAKEEVGKEKERIKRESLFSYNRIWTGYHDRPGRMDIREEILLRDGPICANCGNTYHPSEVQVDHIILRARFKDPTDADRLENLQVLCTECHRAKTKIDLKVLSRVR